MFTRIREQEGAIALLTAFILIAFMAASAVAVDVGRLAITSRDQQGATDRAALDGLLALQSGDLDVPGAVADSLALNTGFSGTGVSTARTVEQRPVSCGPGPGDYSLLGPDAWGDLNATGVEVVTESSVGSLFLRDAGESTVERHAVACGRAIAAISAAGTTATVDDGLVGALLDGLTGGALSLSLVGWEGLAQADVLLADLAVALGAGTLDQLLETEVTAGSLAQAMVAALQAGGNTADIDAGLDIDADLLAALAALDANIPGLPPFTVGELLDVSTSAEAALATSVDAFGLLLTGLQIANHKSGIAFEVDLPGVTALRLRITEPPNIAIGPPGSTVARGSQLGLDVRLPVGVVTTPGAPDPILTDIAERVQPFRDEISGLTVCSTALAQAADTPGTIRYRLEAAIDEVNDAAAAVGLGAVVGGLVGTVDGIISGLLGGLGCSTFLTREQTLNSLKGDLNELADLYEQILLDLAGHEVAPPQGSSSPPALSLRLAQATNTLTGVSCADEGQVQSRVRGEAARVAFTAWTDEYVANPTAAPVQLVDVNLGLLRAQVSLGLDTPLGSSINELVLFDGPFPVYHQQGTTVAGLDSVLTSVTPITSGTHLLGLPIGNVLDGLVDTAFGLLTPVLVGLDPVLSSVVDLLGAEVGGVRAGALDTDCSGRVLIR